MLRTFLMVQKETCESVLQFLSRGHKVEAVVHFSKLTPIIYVPLFQLYSIQIIATEIY